MRWRLPTLLSLCACGAKGATGFTARSRIDVTDEWDSSFACRIEGEFASTGDELRAEPPDDVDFAFAMQRTRLSVTGVCGVKDADPFVGPDFPTDWPSDGLPYDGLAYRASKYGDRLYYESYVSYGLGESGEWGWNQLSRDLESEGDTISWSRGSLQTFEGHLPEYKECTRYGLVDWFDGVMSEAESLPCDATGYDVWEIVPAKDGVLHLRVDAVDASSVPVEAELRLPSICRAIVDNGPNAPCTPDEDPPTCVGFAHEVQATLTYELIVMAEGCAGEYAIVSDPDEVASLRLVSDDVIADRDLRAMESVEITFEY